MNTKFTNYLLIIIATAFFTGCFNTNRLLKKKPSDPNSFSKSNFDGIYENITYADSIRLNLWTLLSKCKSFKPTGTPPDKDSKVRLTFDGDKKLTVTLINNNQVISNFDLEVKLIDNYLSVKRNLNLIPIPFIFYLHDETKVVLSNDKSGQLDVKYGTRNFLCLILWTNSYKRTYNPKFNKLGT